MWPGLLNELCQHDRKHLSAVSIPKGWGSVQEVYPPPTLLFHECTKTYLVKTTVCLEWRGNPLRVFSLLHCLIWTFRLFSSIQTEMTTVRIKARQKEVVSVHIKLNHGLVHFQSENIILKGSDHHTNDRMLWQATQKKQKQCRLRNY